MPMYAKDYVILRGIPADGTLAHDLPRQPARVATLMNEAEFLASGGLMKHLETVFFEERHHDWRWDNGQFFYYTRVSQRSDVVIVYETTSTAPDAS